MKAHNVLKTIYIDNDDNDFLKYEIIGDHDMSIEKAIISAEVKSKAGDIDGYILIKIGEITFDHLSPPKVAGFQRSVMSEMLPGISLGSVVDECKKHRASWKGHK
ncbi:hypothetical protein RGP13_000015 [Morganella morganii]|uniref:hypothetical protein n=1 Tax=Morganella morganii TaxID=582 RepID=UPI00104C32A4|nr:hypothetical protein [Morganella morganii]ELA9130808.1 hypothetical protein [Morganella morganii]HEI8006648.1 hypothetical protein [Morganella morganii]